MHTYLGAPTHLPGISRFAEGMGRTMRSALRHPFGLTLLTISILLVIAVRFLPVPNRLAEFAPWMLLWGFVAYGASVLTVNRLRPSPAEPELRELYAVRHFMARELARRKRAQGNEGSVLTRVLSDAIHHLDRQVTPELQRLLARHQELSRNLARYDNGELPLPASEVLERLRQIHARQRAAIDECVQQASNAAGTLVALLQEGDEARVATEAQKWARDLLTLYDAIADVLRGEEDDEASDPLAVDRGAAGPLADGTEESAEDLRPLVEEALRQLNSVAALSQCQLISQLPSTIAAVRARSGAESLLVPTPLEQAQALREAIISSIELMNPEGDLAAGAAPDAIQYHILYRQYVLSRPTRHIMTRYSIAESTYHRYRREAVSVLATHLEIQEEVLRRDSNGMNHPPPLLAS